MTIPSDEWPTSTTAPRCCATALRVMATSSESEPAPVWTTVTRYPSFVRTSLTCCQPVALVDEPCRSTTFRASGAVGIAAWAPAATLKAVAVAKARIGRRMAKLLQHRSWDRGAHTASTARVLKRFKRMHGGTERADSVPLPIQWPSTRRRAACRKTPARFCQAGIKTGLDCDQ